MKEPDRAEIRRVVLEVLRDLEGSLRPRSDPAPSGTGRDPATRVLFLFNAGVRKLDEALEQVRLIEESGVKSGVYTGPSARGWVCGGDVRDATGARCILDTVSPDGVDTVLQRADVLVLPTLCLTVAAKVAGLTCDDQESRLVLSALLRGKKVLAARDGFLVCDLLANDRIRDEIDRVLSRLEAFGAVFSPTSQLNETFLRLASQGPGVKKPDEGPKAGVAGNAGAPLRLITAKVIANAVNHRQHTVLLAPGGLVTPLARDLAKERGVNIIRDRKSDPGGPGAGK